MSLGPPNRKNTTQSVIAEESFVTASFDGVVSKQYDAVFAVGEEVIALLFRGLELDVKKMIHRRAWKKALTFAVLLVRREDPI